MENLLYIALPVLFIVGVCIGFVAQRVITTRRIGDADVLAKRIVEESRKEAQAQKKEILLQGQDDLYNQKKELENEFREREREMKSRERKLDELGARPEEKDEKATEKERGVRKPAMRLRGADRGRAPRRQAPPPPAAGRGPSRWPSHFFVPDARQAPPVCAHGF